jgi:transcriptional regulator with XRE-family HTH domain
MEVRDELRSEIGKGLQWLRKSLALTQYQLAALAHLDYRHYQNIETGRVEVKVETLKRICDAFGFGLSAFFSLVDRKPWLQEKNGKLRGSGDVYVFRIEHEHSHFRLFIEVKELLLGWGRDLAEGNRDSLQGSPFPCIEIDRRGKCLWKNHSSHHLAQIQVNVAVAEALTENSDAGSFLQSIEQFFEKKIKSIYQEVMFSHQGGANQHHSYYALVGLDSQSPQQSQSVYLACIDISKHFKVSDSEALNPEVTQLLLYCYNSNLRVSRGSNGKS